MTDDSLNTYIILHLLNWPGQSDLQVHVQKTAVNFSSLVLQVVPFDKKSSLN